MKKVGILYHPKIEAAHILAKALEDFLTASGVSTWLCSAWEEETARAQLDDTDFILTSGGDGTILRAAHLALPEQIPITGVNLGKLGFMTELSADEAIDRLPALLAGDGWVDERTVLETELTPTKHEHKPVQTFYALNDVVVARGAAARIVYVDASIDGEPLTTYKADGVIVATATGSTGYSLSAGGPILYPQTKEFLLLPILPHLSLAYTVVLPSTVVVTLRISTHNQATLSIDGHINLPLSSDDTVTIKHSSKKVRFLRIHPKTSFYGSLEQRLKGKQVK
ncbi:NAD(+)/NADH kinase [Chloroflexota bacterium]